MYFTNVRVSPLSCFVALAIAMAMSITAFAQDSTRHRTPRRAVPGPIQPAFRLADVTRAVTADFNNAQGPGAGPIGPGPAVTCFQRLRRLAQRYIFRTSVRRLRRSIRAWSARFNCLTPAQLIPSTGTVTIPLYLGHMKNGKNVWYILSDVDDAGVAAELGLNFSAKMSFMANAARTANLDQNGDLVFDAGTVDFSPVRSVTPGPVGMEFPPSGIPARSCRRRKLQSVRSSPECRRRYLQRPDRCVRRERKRHQFPERQRGLLQGPRSGSRDRSSQHDRNVQPD